MCNLSAVIFDMDGVIVDSEKYWRDVEVTFLKPLLPQWTVGHQRSIFGMSVKDVHQYLVREMGLRLSYEEYLAYYDSLADNIYGQQVSLMAGVENLMQELTLADVKFGLCSSSPRRWVEIVIERFKLFNYLSSVTSGSDILGPSKPDPAIYKLACQSLGCDKQLTIAIEDSDKGLKSAVGAGIGCLVVKHDFNESHDFSLALKVTNSLEDESLATLTALLN